MAKTKKAAKGKKGEKGGKGGKKEPKVGRDQELTTALTNAKIWAARVDIIDKSRQEYRNACQALAANNEDLQDELQRTERDTVDVLSFLKQAELRKEERIVELEATLRDFEETMKSAKTKITKEFENKLTEKIDELSSKDQEIHLLQKELLKVKEFRHKKTMMQEEIEQIKRQLYKTTLEHETSVQNMDRKFFDEKIKLEKEAGNRIAELAERAHSEAVRQLDVTTRQVYQDNVRLTDALSKHIEENTHIRKDNDSLKEISGKLQLEIQTNDKTIKRKILETKFFKEKNKDMQLAIEDLNSDKVQAIEYAEADKSQALVSVSEENQGLGQKVNRLERALELQGHDMRKLRRAANRVLKQRSDVESFLVTALDHIRCEIKSSRNAYIKAMEHGYQEQMQRAFRGEADYPQVTTFKKQLPHDKSTRSVYDKLSTADEFGDANKPVDISDMTWEQRERVLRHLFAQINNLDKDKREHVMRIKRVDQTASTSKQKSIGLGIVPQKETLPPIGKLSLQDNTVDVDDSEELGGKSTTFLTEVHDV